METRTIIKVHFTNMNDILKNMAMRKYMIQYCRENDGFISLEYKHYGDYASADLTSSLSMKNSEIPENSIVELDVQGNDSEVVADFIVRNLDALTLVEEE